MSQHLLEVQNNIIEWQTYIIGELMRLYSTEQDFRIPEELAQAIQNVRELKQRLNTP